MFSISDLEGKIIFLQKISLSMNSKFTTITHNTFILLNSWYNIHSSYNINSLYNIKKGKQINKNRLTSFWLHPTLSRLSVVLYPESLLRTVWRFHLGSGLSKMFRNSSDVLQKIDASQCDGKLNYSEKSSKRVETSSQHSSEYKLIISWI